MKSTKVPKAHSRATKENTIQQAVLEAIKDESFNDFALPTLSDAMWAKIAEGTSPWSEENDRLEFVGDGMINAAIAVQLYRQVPEGTPGLYSVRFALFLRCAEAYYSGADNKLGSSLEPDFRVPP